MGFLSANALWASAALLLFALYTIIIKSLHRRSLMKKYGCKEPPHYPHWDPFLGYDLYRDMVRASVRGNVTKPARERFQRLGRTYKAKSMGWNVIHTMDPQNIQTICALSLKNFGAAPLRKASGLVPLLGHGVLSLDGPEWAQARASTKPIFARSSIADFSTFGKHFERALALVPRDGSTVDLQPIFKRLYLDTMTDFLFGESTNSLLAAEESEKLEATQLLAAFDRAVIGIRKTLALGVLRFLRRHNQEQDKAIAEVHRFVDKLISRAIERNAGAKHDNQRRTILVDELLKDSDDHQYLRSQLLNIFGGGRDTAAVAASQVFFQLARQPEVWSKLRAEVLAIQEPLSFELFKSMKYLQNVLRECLRLIGPANLSQRVCLADSVLPRGGGVNGEDPVLVLKGDMVVMNFHVLQRDPEYWGDESDSFQPERWETARPSWVYIPFLGGGRICPAQQMVMGQLAYILVRFVQEFPTMENRDPEEKFIEEIKILCESRNGVQVAFPSI